MKRLQLGLLVGLVLGAITWALASNYKVVFEAEDYVSITPSMTKTASALASGGAYVQVPVKRPHGETEGAPSDEGKAVYKVNLPADGKYRFWALCHWHDGCGNSFFLKIDDKPAVVLGQDGTYQRWHWVKGPSLQLTAGAHTVVLQYREDGAKMDQALFTTDQRYVPVRAEKKTQ